MKKPWTARELAELRRRYEAGETDAAIAVALGADMVNRARAVGVEICEVPATQ